MLKQVGPSAHPHYVDIDQKNGDRLVEEKEVYVTTAKYVTTENHEPLDRTRSAIQSYDAHP
jgi:hypothetical protein